MKHLTTETKRTTTDSQLLTIYKYMKERKVRTLNVRITTREKTMLKEKAERKRISLSQLIREYCKSNN